MNPITMIFIGVIVVIFLIAGVVMGISLLHGSSASALVEDITSIQSNVEQVYGVQGNYAGISASSTIIPKEIRGTTPIGGTFTVTSGSSGLPAYEFQVNVEGINASPSLCEKIVSQVSTVQTQVNGASVGNSNGVPTGAQAASACSGGATALSFVFSNGQ